MEGSLLTKPQAAERLTVSARTVHTLIKKGLLKCVRIGESVRIDTRDIAAFIDSQRAGPATAKE
jgi:excisionase family DNA binding protein